MIECEAVLDAAVVPSKAVVRSAVCVHLLLAGTRRAITVRGPCSPIAGSTEDGRRWHIPGNPDGNEFRVLEPPASYWQD